MSFHERPLHGRGHDDAHHVALLVCPISDEEVRTVNSPGKGAIVPIRVDARGYHGIEDLVVGY